jgi:hypothetical protein
MRHLIYNIHGSAYISSNEEKGVSYILREDSRKKYYLGAKRIMSKDQVKCFATGDGIICAALPRSGTASLAAALKTLGFGPVHHGLLITDQREFYAWGHAAWCNLDYVRASKLRSPMDRLPFYMNPGDALLPWTRCEWDRLIGRKRVVSDMGSFFTEQL